MADMISLALFVLAGTVPFSQAQAPPRLNLQADPQILIPGLTQTLTLTCGPGHLANQYREVFLIQLLEHEDGGPQRPLATLQPGHAPTLTVPDPRVTVSGSLDMLVPDTAVLKLMVDRPSSPVDAGTVECQVVGLGNDGNVLKNTETLTITVHPESEAVARELKVMVADMKREADGLLLHTQFLRLRNQQLSRQYNEKKAALTQKTTELQQLKRQADSLRQTVEDSEQQLNSTAGDLVEAIANVTAHAPARRVAFNALENTEKVYGSGAQIQLETVEMNEGGGYNSTTSIFRPPVAGVYHFTSTQLVHDTSGSAAVRVFTIKRNSTIIGGAANSDDHQTISTYKQSSTSTVISLTPYDLIGVYQYYSSSAYSALSPYSDTPNGRSTNFAGYLLH